MAHLDWQESTGELRFRLSGLSGTILANGERFSVMGLEVPAVDAGGNPGGAGAPVRVGEPVMAPYRVLARDAWMGELRVMPHAAEPTETGLRVLWRPRLAHQAQVVLDVTPREPNILDFEFEVVGHRRYPGYEIIVSNYFAEGFTGGAYARRDGVPAGGAEEPPQGELVRPSGDPVFSGMYVGFPRDEAAANLMSDGRWQRGRSWTRFLAARYYALPLGFFAQKSGPLDAVVMGLADDVAAVSMAYALEGTPDRVSRHNSLYLHLFGRDLAPGEAWRTRARLVVGPFDRDAAAHRRLYEEFAQEAAALNRKPPVTIRTLAALQDPVAADPGHQTS